MLKQPTDNVRRRYTLDKLLRIALEKMISINKLERNKPKCFLYDHLPEYAWEAYF